MRIVTTTVEQTTFGAKTANAARIAAAHDVIGAVADPSSLLVLPAGYLRTDAGADEAAIRAVARPVLDRARRAGLAIALGVDACGEEWAGRVDLGRLVERQALPRWAVAWAPGTRERIWRQRSTSSANARRCEPAVALERRTLRVRGRQVEIVIGGEGFNADLRAAIGARAAELTAVVLLAHRAAGARHWQAQRWFATAVGVPALRSVHAHTPATNDEGLPRRAAPPERPLAIREGPPWIASVAYTFPA